MTIFNGKQVMLVGLKGEKGDPGIGADVIMSSADDQDLNNYTDTGVYSFDDRATQTNKPNNYSGGFILFVSKQEEQSCTPITQLLMGKNGECWYRSTNDSDGSDRETSWSEWISIGIKQKQTYDINEGDNCILQNINNKDITINLTSSNAKLAVMFADVKDCVVFIDTSNYKPALDSNSQMLQMNFFKNNKSYISQDAVKIQIKPISTTQTISLNKLIWTETYSFGNWAFEGEHNINAWFQVYNSTTPLTDGGQLRFHYRITFNGYAPSVEMIPYYVEEV